MKFIKRNIFFAIFLVIIIIPQTRKQIQIIIHKGISYINPVNLIDNNERQVLKDYDFLLYKEDGEPSNLKDVKGNVILINFWATWCPPCIAEMPSFQRLYDVYKKDVVFLFITNETNDKVLEFKIQNNYSLPVYQIGSNPPKLLEIQSIPRTILINKKGEIVIDKAGAVDWFSASVQSEIDRLLKE